MSNKASHYQKAVFDHFAARAGNAAIIAVAGSGKTWTAIEAIDHLPLGTSVLLGAFNTSIRDEFKERGEAKGYKNVTYTNYNGFGWGICLRNLKRKPELDKFKTRKLLEFQILKPKDDEGWQLFNNWMVPIERLVSAFKSLAIMTPEEAWEQFDDIVHHHNMELPDGHGFKECVVDTFAASIAHMNHFDFDDQKFMPLLHNWPIPKYDQVILDEFQDTCPVEFALMGMAIGRQGQIACFGDPDQSIYGFKNADPRRFEDFKREMRAYELPLSICYRCPTEVVAEAQKIVPRIEAAPGNPKGYVGVRKYEKFLNMTEGGDFVLCRTTDELIGTQIALTRMGKKAKVRGRDFGTALATIIDRVSNGDASMSIGDFSAGLLDYQLKRSEQLTSLRREQEVTALEDRIKSIQALSDQCFRVQDVYERMKAVFTDVKHDGVDLMTCHKSKGLQAQNVYVLRPDLMPHPRSKDRQWMIEEEDRLKYVTITRSTENLVWVDPK